MKSDSKTGQKKQNGPPKWAVELQKAPVAYFLAGAFAAGAFAAGAALPAGAPLAAGAAAPALAAGAAALAPAAGAAAAPAAASAGAGSAPATITTETSTGLFLPWVTAVTPFGSTTSDRCNEAPFFRPLKSTAMNSGRSAGRHFTSISVTTWLAMQPSVFTAGEFSSPL